MTILEDLKEIKISHNIKSDHVSEFIIEPFLPGYGMTVGHALRRVILTSLEGAAVSYVRIEGVDHEFSTLRGMKEDVVDLILNLKKMRVRSDTNDPVTIKLAKKGPAKITAKDFEANADITIADPDHYLATLDKGANLNMEVIIEKGRGYVPVEAKTQQKLPIGTISVDAIFTPIKKVHYNVEKTRVGGKTDFDRLILELTTDGTITPAEALEHAAGILIEHFNIVKNGAREFVEAAKPKKKTVQSKKKPSTKKKKKKTNK